MYTAYLRTFLSKQNAVRRTSCHSPLPALYSSGMPRVLALEKNIELLVLNLPYGEEYENIKSVQLFLYEAKPWISAN